MKVNNTINKPAVSTYSQDKNKKTESDKKFEIKSDELKENKTNEEDETKVPDGLLEEKQVEFLQNLKNDQKNKKLVDNQVLGKEQFMHILLRQLANQNPLSPMQDKDFIAQMAQFTSLENMQRMNKNFESSAEDIKAIRNIVGASKSSDYAIMKIKKVLTEVAKHLGIDEEKLEGLDEENPNDVKTKEKENIKTEETKETENSEASKTETDKTEVKDEKAESSVEKVNEEIQKQKAKKEVKSAYNK